MLPDSITPQRILHFREIACTGHVNLNDAPVLALMQFIITPANTAVIRS